MPHRLLARLSAVPIATALLLGLAGCGGGTDGAFAPVAVGDTVIVTEAGQVSSFNRAAPGTTVGSRAISGLAAGETVAGIDYRPADALLYALGTRGNIYTLDPATGRATLRSTLKAAAGDDQPFISLQGTQFGVDFNPVADRLRVVSNTGQNLRINVDTGDTITDGSLVRTDETGAAAVPSATAAAYTQSFRGTISTQLYVLDLTLGRLMLQDPPNNGTLSTGVVLGVLGGGLNGFDIESRSNTGYAIIRVGTVTSLYRIDLTASTQAAALVATLGSDVVTGLALVQAN